MKKLYWMGNKFAALIASLAVLVAVASVSSTCFFTAYQPDVPDELK